LGQRPNDNEELHRLKVLRLKALRQSETTTGNFKAIGNRQ